MDKEDILVDLLVIALKASLGVLRVIVYSYLVFRVYQYVFL